MKTGFVQTICFPVNHIPQIVQSEGGSMSCRSVPMAISRAQLDATERPDTSLGEPFKVKLAVITANGDLYEKVHDCFAQDSISCHRIDPAKGPVIRALQRGIYSAALYDVGHALDAADALFQWRACHTDSPLPLIALARLWGRDIERVFHAGADDVVLHPFDFNELRARTNVLLRRAGVLEPEPDRIQVGCCVLDRPTKTGWLHGAKVRLTSHEFAMSWLLFSKAGECVGRKQIAHAVWGCAEEIVARPLEQHIYRLRKKLSLDGRSGALLRTVYARGYVLEAHRSERVNASEEDAQAAVSLEPCIGCDADQASYA